MEDVGGPDAVDAGRADIPARVDQGAELSRDLTVGAEMHDGDLDNTISSWVEPRRLDVDHREAASRGSLLQPHFNLR